MNWFSGNFGWFKITISNTCSKAISNNWRHLIRNGFYDLVVQNNTPNIDNFNISISCWCNSCQASWIPCFSWSKVFEGCSNLVSHLPIIFHTYFMGFKSGNLEGFSKIDFSVYRNVHCFSLWLYILKTQKIGKHKWLQMLLNCSFIALSENQNWNNFSNFHFHTMREDPWESQFCVSSCRLFTVIQRSWMPKKMRDLFLITIV